MDDIAVRLRDMERWDVNVISPSVGRYAVEAADTIDALRARANGYYHEAATAYEQRDAAQRDAAALRARVAELEAAAKRAEDALQSIGDEAHDLSTGPTVPDGYWRLREQAYREAEAIGCAGNKGGSRDG